MTQEQLSEALGVTVGAVYKWEAGLSVPDILLIVELADFFDTSVDVLLGYELKNNKQQEMIKNIKELRHNKDEKCLVEVDKALIRYPYCFEIVYESALAYQVFGMIRHDNSLSERAIELFERACLLIGQNNDSTISELQIRIEIAYTYANMSQGDKAVELLINNNVCGINNAIIGLMLGSSCNRLDEAIPYLSNALLDNIVSLSRIAMGYFNVCLKKKDYMVAVDFLKVILKLFNDLKSDENSFLVKISASLYICLAMAQNELGNIDEAREALITAKLLAEQFDQNPNYSVNNIRFVTIKERKTAFDDLGSTAMDSISSLMTLEENVRIADLWKEINGDLQK
ncbi:MAG: helix-turn-helix transcriptional regulator [Clostridiales bacterium]|nr:helix-turn-helix transcriptional regulator [Clostridiales bacterium]